MSVRAHDKGGAGTELALATLAFTTCFYAWSLLGPLSPDLQDALDLSDFQTSAMVAVPVLLGSLMRIPLGWLTDRLGGRRVFTALMAFTPLPLIALALFHDSLGAILAFGFLLGFAGASFAVCVPFFNSARTTRAAPEPSSRSPRSRSPRASTPGACSDRSAPTSKTPWACRTSRPRRWSPSPSCWAR